MITPEEARKKAKVSRKKKKKRFKGLAITSIDESLVNTVEHGDRHLKLSVSEVVCRGLGIKGDVGVSKRYYKWVDEIMDEYRQAGWKVKKDGDAYLLVNRNVEP